MFWQIPRLMSEKLATSGKYCRFEFTYRRHEWLMTETGWTHDKISRLCRLRQIKGAFQSQPGTRGSMWHFRKAKTLAWLESLEVK